MIALTVTVALLYLSQAVLTGGDVSAKNIWLAESVLDILTEHRYVGTLNIEHRYVCSVQGCHPRNTLGGSSQGSHWLIENTLMYSKCRAH